MYLAPHVNDMSPFLSGDCAVMRHPGKSRKAGREPGSRKNLIILHFRWIPDLVRLGGLVRNDGVGWL